MVGKPFQISNLHGSSWFGTPRHRFAVAEHETRESQAHREKVANTSSERTIYWPLRIGVRVGSDDVWIREMASSGAPEALGQLSDFEPTHLVFQCAERNTKVAGGA